MRPNALAPDSAALSLQVPQPIFSSKEGYRSFCHSIIAMYRSSGIETPATPTFESRAEAIQGGGAKVISTPWGGVDILTYEHPHVEEVLVVRAGKFLAFERHEEKIETLIVEEGIGILVYRPFDGTGLKAEIITPGWAITLQPGQEHTIVALSNLLVRERSIDPKGMDNDLIFIFTPEDT